MPVNDLQAPALERPPSVRDLLDRYGLAAKKSWGQNFLVDDHAYRAILAATAATPADTVVEIGAGLGTLTWRLLRTGATVIAVERERDMCVVLRTELSLYARFQLREENALELDLSPIAEQHGGPLLLVGNLPYQIASPLIFRFLSTRALVHRMIFMLQREVADRLVAAPDSENYGAMAAQVQMLARVRTIRRVSKGCFTPQPKVESGVVLIEPRPKPLCPVRDLKTYSRVVKAAFAQRRKTLRNTMTHAFGEAGATALQRAQIDPGRRGETLSIAEFARIADTLPETALETPDEIGTLTDPA